MSLEASPHVGNNAHNLVDSASSPLAATTPADIVSPKADASTAQNSREINLSISGNRLFEAANILPSEPLGLEWRDQELNQIMNDHDAEIVPVDDFSAEWVRSWESARLPATRVDVANDTSIAVATPEQQMLSGYAAYWMRHGAVPIDRSDGWDRDFRLENGLSDLRIIRDMERYLRDHLATLSSDLRSWLESDEAVRPVFVRFPESALETGARRTEIPERRRSDEQRRAAAQIDDDIDKMRKAAPTQFSVQNADPVGTAYYIVASLRNGLPSQDSIACWGNSLVRFSAITEDGENRLPLAPYRPVTLMQMRVIFPKAGGPPKTESDVMYSPNAFRIARDLLREDGIPLESGEDRRMHGHLMATIQGAISRQVPGFKPENRPKIGDHPIQVEAILPHPDPTKVGDGKGPPENQLLVICSAGMLRFAVNVSMFIWFPEDGDPSISRRKSDESPYIVRCACSRAPLPEHLALTDFRRKR